MKDKIIRVRISNEQLITLQYKAEELKKKYPHKRITVGTVIRFMIHCFTKETCCIGKSRLESILSYNNGNSGYNELL